MSGFRNLTRQVAPGLTRTRGAVVITSAVAYVVFAVLFLTTADTETRSVITGVTSLFFSVLAIGASIAAWRRPGLDRRSRNAWLLLACSIASISAASATLFLYDLTTGTRPTVSIADLFYFLFYGLFLAGILSLTAAGRRKPEVARLLFDVAIVMTAGGAIIWQVVFAPAVLEQTALGAGEWLAFVWPVLDLTLLFGATLGLTDRSGGRRRSTLQLIALAGIAMFAGDLTLAGALVRTGSYASGDHANLLWLLSAVLWIAAAQSMRGGSAAEATREVLPREEESQPRVSTLPYVAMAVAYGLLAVAEFSEPREASHVILLGVLIITALVVARQFLVLRENVRLLAERAELQRELSRQVVQDPVTELATRTHFHTRVAQALQRSGGRPERVAVMFLDLDDFKDVNDSLGHDKGDLLLREVAGRLMHSTRGSDLVARLGGDEFAILVDRVLRDEDLLIMARRIVASIAAPFDLAGSEVLSGVSIGIARAEPGMKVDDLLYNADVAMYDAKDRGKGQFTFFKGEMQRAVVDRINLETDLRRAVTSNEISLLYQPIVNMRTGMIFGVEALVRWQHPTRGVLGPDQFITLAEESGMMIPLGKLVLSEACAQAAQWNEKARGGEFMVALNVSSRQLQHHGLADDVRAALEASGLPHSSLLLEMTENVAVRDPQLTMQRLTRLKDIGVRIAIDNFGSGYSSITELQRFPIDVLKMDKSFVRAAGRSESGLALARTILSLGKALGVETFAEGVESRTEADLLLQMGCQVAQGYHYAKPAPASEIDAMLESQQGSLAAR